MNWILWIAIAVAIFGGIAATYSSKKKDKK